MKENRNKIPKIIHYCWFGEKDKPGIVKKCIESWNKYLIDYEIIEWNEDNFDISSIPYVNQAYQSKKFAFVSDYVRVYALYNYGGIYLDTDVEVFKSFDNLLHHDSFWGFEQENYIATSTIGATRENTIIKSFLESYKNKDFKLGDGSFNETTNVAFITKMLEEMGLVRDGSYQKINDNDCIYPQTHFSPYDYINCRVLKTCQTYTIHHFYKSWLPFRTRVKTVIKLIVAKIIGGENILRIRRLLLK
ncbi:glycosyltransferase family 32 protein [Litchfieldia alkalitelluris]|uniref:glycosyltransferase family 32 protein n=1 Tax=Litchfieldia alkalitelluris TaxID=304268 RepID=UPI0009982FA2|nr:glycosyltransferase [Litchfieldia alkalitelluris]